VTRLWARADRTKYQQALTYSVRATSTEPVSDTIMNYLSRGDLGAAETMAQWAEQSEELLAGKMSDPYAAAVGGYLLLRLQRFDLMHEWPRNLANWIDFLPDGCVIWAWQLIHQKPEDSAEIGKYLLTAVERGLPVYTKGLQLLLDGLRLLGSDGVAALKKVREQAGSVLWDSPITARAIASRDSCAHLPAEPVLYDIQFGATA
jgi:hypothetical protein